MVLFVDDRPEMLALYSAVADKIPHRTTLCPKEALRFLALQKPQVIITDNDMPGMSGKQFIAQARIHCPDATFIMVTGTPPKFFDLNEKPHEVIQKPFDLRLFQTKLKTLLST